MSTATQILAALQSFKIKQTGKGEYRCNSPFRSGSDSMSFVVKVEDDEHGTYYDHRDESGGSLYELAEKLGIETPKGTQSTKRQYQSLEDYAKAHGVSGDVLVKASWQYEDYQGRPALKFPTKRGYRWRFLDGKTPHYKSVQGYKSCWYGLNQTLLGRLAYGSPLILANGEISTVVGQAYGMAAACVTSGEKDIPNELVGELKAFTASIQDLSIIIALDCDEKGRKTALKVKDTLIEAGFNSVRAVDMQLGKAGDIADFCMLHGKLEDGIVSVPPLSALQNCPDVKPPFEPKEIKRWEIIHASELENLPPVEWLIPGEIPKRGLTVLFGPSGAGKSFYTLDCALRLAQKSPVVYMAGEGQSGYPGRVKAWTSHNRATVGNLYMCMGAVSFMDNTDLSNFIQEVEAIAERPDLIIIDTLARSMLGADENSSRDMGKFVDACEQVQHHFDCAVMIVHHTNKGGVSERGSGALRGSADSMIKLIDEDDLIRVECEKTKDSTKFDPRYMKLLPVDIGMVDREGNKVMPPVMIEAERVIQSESDDLTSNQIKVLETLGMTIYEYGASYTELVGSLREMNERTLQRVLSRLKGLEFIEQTAKREPYKLTDKGREKIGLSSDKTDATDSVDTPNYKSKSKDVVVSKGVESDGLVGSVGKSENEQTHFLSDIPEQNRYYSEGL